MVSEERLRRLTQKQTMEGKQGSAYNNNGTYTCIQIGRCIECSREHAAMYTANIVMSCIHR